MIVEICSMKCFVFSFLLLFIYLFIFFEVFKHIIRLVYVWALHNKFYRSFLLAFYYIDFFSIQSLQNSNKFWYQSTLLKGLGIEGNFFSQTLFSSTMDSETPFTALAPLVFNGEGYHVWAARMEAHLEANDLWKAMEEDYEVSLLPVNPTMAQIKNHKEKKSRKSKARATLFAEVSPKIFVRIMTMKSTFEVCNFLKKE